MNNKVYVLKFPKRQKMFIRNRKLYNKRYQFIDTSTGNINIPKLINTLVTKLKPKVDPKFVRNSKYSQLEFVNGIINVLRNNTYWKRSKETIKGDYLRKNA